MTLSVIHRISGGYGLILICLMAIAIAGNKGINGVNNGLQQITQDATPIKDSTEKLAREVAAVNLAIYLHYNSSNIDELTNYETHFQDFSQNFANSAQDLIQLLQQVENSQAEVARLNNLLEQTPGTFEDIERVMRLHHESFIGLQKQKKIRLALADKEQEIKDILDTITQLPLSDATLIKIYTMELLLNRGISLANQIALVSTLEDFKKRKDAFSQWLNEYVESRFNLFQEEINARTDLGKLLIKQGTTVSGFTWTVIKYNGLIQSKEGYIADKSLLATNLTNNQQALLSLRSELNNIKIFADDFSKTVKTSANEAVDQGQVTILIISALAVVASMIIAFIVINSIRKPLRQVVRALERVAKGDLTKDVKVTQKDEFGILQASASSLYHSLREMIEAIGDQSRSITASVGQTQHVSEQAQITVGEQNEQTTMVATAMHQMSATINEIADSANNTFTKMIEAHESAESSQQQIDQNKQQTLALQAEINHTSEVVTQLDTDVHKIQEILQVIEAIADQVNLLALNAAIEAARAGEQGRGFAVVADEVRSLAGRTRLSTEEIKTHITTLLEGSQRAVSAMEISSSKTIESVELAQVINQQIDGIVGMVSNAKDLNMQIATAAEQQSSTAKEIDRNIVRITELSDDTEKGAQETQKQVTLLHQSTADLEKLVARFQL